MDTIASFVIKHRRLVLLFWLIAMLIGFASTGKTTSRLTSDFSIPSQPGFATALQVERTFGSGGLGNSAVVLIKAPAGQSVVDSAQAKAFFTKLAHQFPTTRVVDPISTPAADTSGFISKDRTAALGLVYLPQPTAGGFDDMLDKSVETYVGAHSSLGDGFTAVSTGYDQLESSTDGGGGNGLLVEVLFGGLGALIVLAFVFASLLAFLPLAVAIVSIPTTFAVLLPLTYFTHVNMVAEFLVGLIGLGVAIDYSLLVVTRWREERDKGLSNEGAVRVAIQQAGHSVVFSGGAVAIGLLSLTVLPVPWLRSLGIAGMLIPLISTLVTITLTPAILLTVGPRLDYPHIRSEVSASKLWTKWARGVVKRPVPAAVAALVILGLLCIPLTGIKIGLSGLDSLASTGPAHSGLQSLRSEGLPEGSLTPMEILVKGGDTAAVAAAAKDVSGVAAVSVPAAFNRNGEALVEVLPTDATVNSQSTDVVTRLRTAVDHLPGVVGVSGVGAVQLDYAHAVYGNFPLLILVLVLLTFVALARAFRSVLLALKAVILNLISLGATFGAMTLVWQQGHGSDAIFGISQTGAITFWVPILVFAFLYGLSMDYEVFILTRMRESYDKNGRTADAVVEGLGRTGRLVTSAALILFLAFVSLASSPGTDIKVLATGLGAGILLDATVVRALLVPALVTLFGRFNWWLPNVLAKPLFVEPHAAVVERAAQPQPELV